MYKEDLKPGLVVINKKYGNHETVLFCGIMKQSNGIWVESVTYKGIDRFTNKENYFTKELNEFLNDFEL